MSQRQAISRIYQQRLNDIDTLNEKKNKLIVSMYRSLTQSKALNIKFNKDELPIFKPVLTLYKRLNKRKEVDIPGTGIVSGSLMYAYLINKSHISEKTSSRIKEYVNDKTNEHKEAFIMSDLQKNRIEHKIFYLCSSHDDCAEDHLKYQGKLYIDENWRDYAKDVKAVSKYVNAHKIKQYQWVMGSPVWLLTRPHCRHYMQPLSESEVLGSSASGLIDKYNMHRKIGSRDDIQTLGSRGKEIETMINAYTERLELLNKMYKVAPNRYLQGQINKNAILRRKWVNMRK